SGAGKLRVWKKDDRSETTPLTWDLSTVSQPGTLWVEGLAASDAVGDQVLEATYDWCIHLDDNVQATVEPREGDSEAVLKILQKKRSGTGFIYSWASGDLSNWVYPVVEVKVAPGEQLVAPESGVLHLRVEEDSSLHAWADRHFDIAVLLNDTTGWWKRTSACGQPETWEPLEGNERVTDSNKDGASAQVYRWDGFLWNTVAALSGTDVDGQACKILGHNGPHLLSLAKHPAGGGSSEDVTAGVSFHEWDPTVGGWKDPYAVTPSGISPTVANITFTDVKTNVNEDYFIYDPTDTTHPERQQPPFSFKINDGVNQGGYQFYIPMRDTSNMTWPTDSYGNHVGPYVLGQTADGNATATWNGKLDNGTGADVTDPCTYTFDIWVWETPNINDWSGSQLVDDSQWMKYNYYLWIPENYTANGEVKPGHELSFDYDEEAGDAEKAYISFYYEDYYHEDPLGSLVYLLDGDFNVKAAYAQTPVHDRTPYEGIDIYTLTDQDKAGDWRAIFTGFDNHREGRRDHEWRRIVAINQRTMVNAISLREIYFLKTGPDDLVNLKDRDGTGLPVAGRPHWKENKIATTLDDEKFPVCYHRSQHWFDLSKASEQEATGLQAKKRIVMKAKFAGRGWVRVRVCANDDTVLFGPVTVSLGSALHTLKDNIGLIPRTVDRKLLEFRWQWQPLVGINAWTDFPVRPTTRHRLYVLNTGNTPVHDAMFELVHLSCGWAAGKAQKKDVTDLDPPSDKPWLGTHVFNAIWYGIKQLSVPVPTWDRVTNSVQEDGPIYYWQTSEQPPLGVAKMLRTKNGSCEAWTRFLRDMTWAHGMVSTDPVNQHPDWQPDGVSITYADPYPAGTYDHPTRILVKDWNAPGQSLTVDDQWIEHGVEWIEANLEADGLVAQGNATPAMKIFPSHAIVRFANRYFDPSYGISETSTNDLRENLRRYALRAIAGLAKNENLTATGGYTSLEAIASNGTDSMLFQDPIGYIKVPPPTE
ncbi:MAG: hypothetical protein HY318_19865, partial [Armatimonadetes bacterium]|nr:hypothetical protein [Armatimonadota bacterium]